MYFHVVWQFSFLIFISCLVFHNITFILGYVKFQGGKNIKITGRLSSGREYQVGKNIKRGRLSSGKTVKVKKVGMGRGRKGLRKHYLFFPCCFPIKFRYVLCLCSYFWRTDWLAAVFSDTFPSYCHAHRLVQDRLDGGSLPTGDCAVCFEGRIMNHFLNK